MAKENIIQHKTFDFAIKIYHFSKALKKLNEFEIASQVLRSGTSIGANTEEAIGGFS